MTPEEIQAARGKLGKLEIVKNHKGERIGVIRPADPALALQLANVAVKHNELFDQIPQIVDDYTFAGWMAKPARNRDPKVLYLVDDGGLVIDVSKPGDSFVPESAMVKAS